LWQAILPPASLTGGGLETTTVSNLKKLRSRGEKKEDFSEDGK